MTRRCRHDGDRFHPRHTGDYTLDPAHTRIGFSARQAMVTNVRAAFHDFDGHAHFDIEDPPGPRSWWRSE